MNEYGRSDPLLTNMSIDRRNAAVGFIAEFGAPSVPTGADEATKKSFGEYYIYDQGNNFQEPDNKKSDGGVSREIFFNASTGSFKTKPYGSRAGYTQKELNDFGVEHDLRKLKMNMVTDADMIAHERRVCTLLTTAGSYASANKTTLTGANQWSDASSDPFGNIITAKEAITSGDAVPANAMINSFLGHNQLIQHPDILSRLQAQNLASGLEDVTPAKVGELFGLDYKVAQAQYKTSKKGQTFTSSYAWGDFALVFHKTPTAAKESISLAYTFTYENFIFRTYFEDKNNKFWVDNAHDVVSLLIAASVGYLISDTIA